MNLFFWRKKAAEPEPVRKKRIPKTWDIPKASLAEVIKLYDEMNVAGQRILPRHLFWTKVADLIPEVCGLNVQAKPVGDLRSLIISETVKDDDYEVEDDTKLTEKDAEQSRTAETIEDKLE
jgi:hypothetical protein